MSRSAFRPAGRPLDEAQGLHVALIVNPVAGIAALGGRDQANALVIADGLGRDPGFLRDGSDLLGGLPYNASFLSLSALPITETELKLMAAAAIIGLSNSPKIGYRTPAAIGTPRLL